MPTLYNIRNYRLVAYVTERKQAEKISVRQLTKMSGVSKSSVERFLKHGCSDMAFKDAVQLLYLLGISPTQAADMLGIIGPLPQNKEEAVIVETAWKLSQLSETGRHAIIKMVNQRFEMEREREEVS